MSGETRGFIDIEDINKRSRAWAWTLFDYSQDDCEEIKKIKCVYICFGKEVTPTTNRPHLQGFVYFKNPVRRDTVKSLFPRNDVSVGTMFARVEDNIRYCKKDGDFYEVGTSPLSQKEKGEKGKKVIVEKYAKAYDQAKRGRIDEIEPELIIKHYSTFKQIKRDYMSRPGDADDVTGVWIVGPAGCGKSSYARRRWPDHYLKPCNKWWDGYQDQPYAILDDVDPHHRTWIGQLLKLWTDRYAFIAEKKCDSVQIRPKKFIITSQYYIHDVFEDHETRSALQRRCQLIDMNDETVRRECKNYRPPPEPEPEPVAESQDDLVAGEERSVEELTDSDSEEGSLCSSRV